MTKNVVSFEAEDLHISIIKRLVTVLTAIFASKCALQESIFAKDFNMNALVAVLVLMHVIQSWIK